MIDLVYEDLNKTFEKWLSDGPMWSKEQMSAIVAVAKTYKMYSDVVEGVKEGFTSNMKAMKEKLQGQDGTEGYVAELEKYM